MLARTMTVKQRLWLDHVKAADHSGGTISQYAKSHDLRLKTLYQWKTKLVKLGLYRPSDHKAESAFVAVKPVQDERPLPTCTVRYASGTVIEFAGELDTQVIRSIMTSTGFKR